MKASVTSFFKKALTVLAFLAGTLTAQAQAKIGDNPTTINPGSVLELESTNKGLLMPRINLTNTTTWGLAGTPAAGMHVYNTNTGITSTNTSYPTLAAKIGEYYWDGTGWVALATVQKATAVYSFSQTTGINHPVPFSSSGIGGQFGAAPLIGSSPPPAYLVDLQRNGSFTITNPTNDVVIDLTGLYSVGGLNGTQVVGFLIYLYVDKTTPGVYEAISFYVESTAPGAACAGGYINFKTVLQNLPARTYNAKVYLLPWYNSGPQTNIGIGAMAGGICGQNDPANQRMIITVSQ